MAMPKYEPRPKSDIRRGKDGSTTIIHPPAPTQPKPTAKPTNQYTRLQPTPATRPTVKPTPTTIAKPPKSKTLGTQPRKVEYKRPGGVR